jgi:hypothetical protein
MVTPAISRTGSPDAATRIERFFTTPGVHPFDEVAWELRSAAIADESGGNVFEQQDVEMPAFWSQTATNVVVSKYFRGPLGTPQRETSVRQLIGRVVDTITGWGVDGGYFLSEEETETFRAELRICCSTRRRASTARSGSTWASKRSRSARPASSSRSKTPWSRSWSGARPKA